MGFVDHLIPRFGAEFSAKRRYGAEGAGVVASLCHAKVGGVLRRQPAPAPLRPKGHSCLANLDPRDGLRSRTRNFAHLVCQGLVVLKAHNCIDFWQLLRKLGCISLCETARDDYASCRRLLHACRLEDGLDGLSLRILDKTTGIDDDNVCIRAVVLDDHAVTLQVAQHHLRVHRIFRTSKRDEGDCNRLRRTFNHRAHHTPPLTRACTAAVHASQRWPDVTNEPAPLGIHPVF
mmetsp:Transcript_1202/g.3715  ORF Transcript_1202/g.3715 Transcript_1202/m.3715 type:complete len:233 (-) Transcript_1202:33-731(-)